MIIPYRKVLVGLCVAYVALLMLVELGLIIYVWPFLLLAYLIYRRPSAGKVITLVVLNLIVGALTVVGGFISFIGSESGTPGSSKAPETLLPLVILHIAMIIVGVMYALHLEANPDSATST